MEQKENNTQETAGKGCLVRMGGQPPVGDNTTIMLHMVSMAALKDRTPAAYFSPGMTNTEVVNRLIAINSGIDHKDIGAGTLSDEQWKKLDASLPLLLRAPLYIDDTPGISVEDLRNKVYDLADNKGVRLVVVDPVRLMTGDNVFDNDRQRTDYITERLRGIAEDLGITIFAVEE